MYGNYSVAVDSCPGAVLSVRAKQLTEMICSSDNKSSVTVAENWWTFRFMLFVLGSKRHALQFPLLVFFNGKPYGLQRNAFEKFLLKGSQSNWSWSCKAKVAACFQVCLHCSPLSLLRSAVGLHFRSSISYDKNRFSLKTEASSGLKIRRTETVS